MTIPVIAGATLACAAGAIHNETVNNDIESYDTDNLMNMLNLIEASLLYDAESYRLEKEL